MSQLTLTFPDMIGIIGVFILLGAYFALSTDRLKAASLCYQFLNFLAAWLILFSLFYEWNTASVLIEIAWIIISMIGMLRIILKKKN